MEEAAFPPINRAWRIAAVLSLIVVASAVAVILSDPYPMDFISYWAAAKLALAGDAATAYDVAAHHAVQAGAVSAPSMMPFPYPPPFMLALLSFGLLPFGWAAAVWIGLTLLVYALAVRRLMPGFGAVAIAFPPVIVCGVIGQNGFLTAALLILSVAVLPKRPLLAGFLIACLAIKPQLGVLIPLALIAGREWRAFIGASVSIVALALAGLAAFGIAAWQGFFALLPLYGSIATDGLVGWHKMASVYAALRLAGLPDGVALGAHIAAAMTGALFVWRTWRGAADPLTRAASIAIGTVLVSPYLYVYDQVMLIATIAFLIRNGVSQGVIAALCLLPLVSLAQTSMPDPRINVAPLLPIIMLALMWRVTSREKAGPLVIRPLPA